MAFEESPNLPEDSTEKEILILDETYNHESIPVQQSCWKKLSGAVRLACIIIAFLLALMLAVWFAQSHPDRDNDDFFEQTTNENPDMPARTILISIDGFRHDYLERRWRNGTNQGDYIAKTLRMLMTTGATAPMMPVFPTKTFPNHWAIATGLYPESSGVTGNEEFDIKTGEFFKQSMKPKWWDGEPIWQTIAKEKDPSSNLSESYKTASCFWPGSEVPGKQPTVFLKYDDDLPYRNRVDTVLSFLEGDYPSQRGEAAHFATLYVNGVDHGGHAHGPFSYEVDLEINRADKAVALLLKKLGPQYANQYNIIVVSDHGMAEISDDRVVNLSYSRDDAIKVNISPLAEMFPRDNSSSTAKLLKILQNDLASQGHGKAFLKEDLLERWHLGKGKYVPPVLALANLGWTFKHKDDKLPSKRVRDSTVVHKEWDHGPLGAHHKKSPAVAGDHGYDNVNEEMRGIFIAKGPGLRNESSTSIIQAVDVYPLICHLYGINGAPNNGSLQRLTSLLNRR